MVTIKLKRLHTEAIVPLMATNGAAAFDLYAPCDYTVRKGRNVLPLGWAVEIPEHYCIEIHARSGFSAKGMQGKILSSLWAHITRKRFDADVKFGLIDSDYRGEVDVIIVNRDKPFVIKAGTRVAQACIRRVPAVQMQVVEELSETSRGEGGFGHTGA